MKTNEFKCELCGGIFEQEWSDEEAKEEARRNGFDPDEDSAVVCDDCYEKIMKGRFLTGKI